MTATQGSSSPPADNPFRQSGVDNTATVRSIRVAAALNERLGDLLRKTNYASDEELANALGEARQLYPEIWSHLDDARRALARRGITVLAYDELRSSTAAQQGGVLDVEVTDRTKTAWMNAEGHATAAFACNQLRAALPEVDWQALEAADAAALAAGASLGPSRATKIVFYILAGALALLGIALLIAYKIGVRTGG